MNMSMSSPGMVNGMLQLASGVPIKIIGQKAALTNNSMIEQRNSFISYPCGPFGMMVQYPQSIQS